MKDAFLVELLKRVPYTQCIIYVNYVTHLERVRSRLASVQVTLSESRLRAGIERAAKRRYRQSHNVGGTQAVRAHACPEAIAKLQQSSLHLN